MIPTNYARRGEQLEIHGAAASRLLRTPAGGVPVCVTVTRIDGLVLARPGFHHSTNYPSSGILGTASEVTDPAERMQALHAFVEHVLPGRWNEVRPPSENELRATLVLKLSITEASAKIRTGPPVDDDEDYALPCWAGVVPLALTASAPVPDGRLGAGIAPGEGIKAYRPEKRGVLTCGVVGVASGPGGSVPRTSGSTSWRGELGWRQPRRGGAGRPAKMDRRLNAGPPPADQAVDPGSTMAGSCRPEPLRTSRPAPRRQG